jgi:hypothetical protein
MTIMKAESTMIVPWRDELRGDLREGCFMGTHLVRLNREVEL